MNSLISNTDNNYQYLEEETKEQYFVKEYFKNFKLDDQYLEKLKSKLYNNNDKLSYFNDVVQQDKQVVDLLNKNYSKILNKFEEMSDVINKIEEYSNNISENITIYKVHQLPNFSSLEELDLNLRKEVDKNNKLFNSYFLNMLKKQRKVKNEKGLSFDETTMKDYIYTNNTINLTSNINNFSLISKNYLNHLDQTTIVDTSKPFFNFEEHKSDTKKSTGIIDKVILSNKQKINLINNEINKINEEIESKANLISEENSYLKSIISEKKDFVQKLYLSDFKEAFATYQNFEYQIVILKICFLMFFPESIDSNDLEEITDFSRNKNEIKNHESSLSKYYNLFILNNYENFSKMLMSTSINISSQNLKEYSQQLETCKIEAELSNKTFSYQKTFFPLLRILKQFFYLSYSKSKTDKLKTQVFELRSNLEHKILEIEEIQKRNKLFDDMKSKLRINHVVVESHCNYIKKQSDSYLKDTKDFTDITITETKNEKSNIFKIHKDVLTKLESEEVNKTLNNNKNQQIVIQNDNKPNLNNTLIEEKSNYFYPPISQNNFQDNDSDEEVFGFKNLIKENLNQLKLVHNNLSNEYNSLIKSLSKVLLKPKDVILIKYKNESMKKKSNVERLESLESVDKNKSSDKRGRQSVIPSSSNMMNHFKKKSEYVLSKASQGNLSKLIN